MKNAHKDHPLIYSRVSMIIFKSHGYKTMLFATNFEMNTIQSIIHLLQWY